MIINSEKGRYQLAIIAMMLLYIPLLFSRTDLWDGSIVEHAVSLGRKDVYHEWFLEAGLYLTAYFYDPLAVNLLKDLYPTSGQFFTLVFLYFSALEIKRLSGAIYNISDRDATITAVFFLTLPIWSAYFSTIYLMHSATIFLALLSTRLVITERYLFLPLIFIPVSFQQASMAPLIIALFFLYSIENKFKNIRLIAFYSFWIIFSFFILRLIFKTYGLYGDYNKITVGGMFNLRLWASFLLSVLTCMAMVFIPYFCRPAKFISLSVLSLVVAFVIVILPYATVNKYPSIKEILDMHGNSMRMLFSCAPVIALSLAYTLKVRLLNKLTLVLVFSYGLMLFITAQYSKVSDVVYQRAVISVLKENPDINGRRLTIKTRDKLNFYEFSYMFEKAYGVNNSIIFVNDNIPDPVIYDKETYRIKYMQPKVKGQSELVITVVNNMSGFNPLEVLWTFFSGEALSGAVTISRE